MKIQNNSNSLLLYKISTKSSLDSLGQRVYDRLPREFRNHSGVVQKDTAIYSQRISPQTKGTVFYTQRYENLIRKSEDGKLYIYLFEKETIDSHTWKQIVEKQIYDAKFGFTISELISANWIVTYPAKMAK